MALDFEPLMPHEDDDYDEQPELIPPENPPAPAEVRATLSISPGCPKGMRAYLALRILFYGDG